MLESVVYDEECHSNDDGCYHNEYGRSLEFLPGRPSHLCGELNERLFTIVYELSHLFL